MRMSKRADPHGLRSKHRSALRLCLGTAYYSAQRYLLWMSGKYRFASQRQKDRLPCVHMAHHTPLLRKLKDVEMQYQHNKITNLKLAVARLDGIVVQPGETLSYWKLIGRPTWRGSGAPTGRPSSGIRSWSVIMRCAMSGGADAAATMSCISRSLIWRESCWRTGWWWRTTR